MRKVIATLSVASLIVTIATPAVQAAPTQVNVRIEGRTETLFEGPILTEGHDVRAAESDEEAPKAGRPCDGTNNGQHSTPGPTPTAASVDAMSILGEDFDGKWYEAPLEDYFVKRWGPDGQDVVKGEYWGLIVNNVFTNVGGCQYQLDGGDEVLWAYDAFDGRSRLTLYPAGYTGGPVVPTATAELDEPFEVEVDTWDGYNEGAPPDSPQRTGAAPYEGAGVAPVQTSPEGFQRVETDGAETDGTDSDGTATTRALRPTRRSGPARPPTRAPEWPRCRRARRASRGAKPRARRRSPPPPRGWPASSSTSQAGTGSRRRWRAETVARMRSARIASTSACPRPPQATPVPFQPMHRCASRRPQAKNPIPRTRQAADRRIRPAAIRVMRQARKPAGSAWRRPASIAAALPAAWSG